jgi:hypothetical protein
VNTPTDKPLTLWVDPHAVPEGEKISPDGKVIRVQVIRPTTDGVPTRVRCQDGSTYVNNGRGQLLNPGRTLRKKAAVERRAKKGKR